MNQTTGSHCILELYDCPYDLLDDKEFICETLSRAAEASGSTLLSLTSHKFDPQGVTALGLLAESHISIHTWPEKGYAAADVFTCGTHCDPVKACSFLIQQLNARRHSRSVLQRGPVLSSEITFHSKSFVREETCAQMPPISRYG